MQLRVRFAMRQSKALLRTIMAFFLLCLAVLLLMRLPTKGESIYTLSLRKMSDEGEGCDARLARRHLVSADDHPEAKCMDGTQPAFYVHPSTSATTKNKWLVHFEGGGWSYRLADNAKFRRSDFLGSSKDYAKCLPSNKMKYYISTKKDENPLLYNWNIVYVRYCDGGSYAGDSVAQYENETLYFRGKANRDATIASLLRIGMSSASEVLFSGCSAGGLGLFLGIDQMAAMVRAGSTRSVNEPVKVRGLIDSGFFLNFKSDENFNLRHNSKEEWEAVYDGRLDYSAGMREVFSFMNITAGANPRCIAAAGATVEQRSLCFFPEYLAPHLQTPVFLMQPMYDQWSLWHVLGKPHNITAANKFGSLTKQTVHSSLLLKGTQHGAFIDACTHHCTSCSEGGDHFWTKSARLGEERQSAFKAFASWYGDDGTQAHVYVEEQAYPCTSCCKCRP